MTHKTCRDCSRTYTNPIEIEYIERAGICFGCDKARCDAEEQARLDGEDEHWGINEGNELAGGLTEPAY
jgi:hypothetical protein